MTYVLLTRPPLGIAPPLDLHVLGPPLAFALSQDQTLQFSLYPAIRWEAGCSRSYTAYCVPTRMCSLIAEAIVELYPIYGIERLLLPIFQRPAPPHSTFAVRFGFHFLSQPLDAVHFIFEIFLDTLSKYTCGVLDRQCLALWTVVQR